MTHNRIALLFIAVAALSACHEKTHTYRIEYSINGKPQAPVTFRATIVWDYKDAVEWMDDNNSDLSEAERDRNDANGNGTIGRLERIDKGYKLTELK